MVTQHSPALPPWILDSIESKLGEVSSQKSGSGCKTASKLLKLKFCSQDHPALWSHLQTGRLYLSDLSFGPVWLGDIWDILFSSMFLHILTLTSTHWTQGTCFHLLTSQEVLWIPQVPLLRAAFTKQSETNEVAVQYFCWIDTKLLTLLSLDRIPFAFSHRFWLQKLSDLGVMYMNFGLQSRYYHAVIIAARIKHIHKNS